jgi:hypothetical protein
MSSTFLEYVNRKQKDAVRELRIVKRILKQSGLQVSSHLHEMHEDPYLYVYNPNDRPDFGVRIYKLGGQDIYYRPQKKQKTHPWGEAKTLDLKGMYEDVKSDEQDDDKAAQIIIKSVGDEIKDYFRANAKALKTNKKASDSSPLGSASIRSSMDTGDFSNTSYSMGMS